ncbi:hypothetical protein BOX15_Mlig020794g1 [Macrostomum lignano]|uniref:Uncharacterized protein n=1 Tax=Macrostomum lignano TaxID=282301 RepID=A0A267EP90_9PLAT|nr:hypothetical protein BOX15_Mlig020794g1 [Macrostomum lignano]
MSRWQVRHSMAGAYRRQSPPASSSGGVRHNGYHGGRGPDQQARHYQRRYDYKESYYNEGDTDGYRQNGGRVVSHVPWRDYAYSNLYDSFDSAYSSTGRDPGYPASEASTSGPAGVVNNNHRNSNRSNYSTNYWRGGGVGGDWAEPRRQDHRWDSGGSSRYATYAAAAATSSSRYATSSLSTSASHCASGGGRARMGVSAASGGGGGCLLETPKCNVGSAVRRRPVARPKRLQAPPLPSPIGSDVTTPTGQYACRLCKFGTDDVYSLYVHANTGDHIGRAVQDPAQSLCCRPCNLFASDINDMLFHHKLHENRPEAASSDASEASSAIAPSDEHQPSTATAAAPAARPPSPACPPAASASPPPPPPPPPPQRPVKLKIRCLPCRQAFTRQPEALAHFRNQACQRQCEQWWRSQTASGGQPQSFFVVQCRGCSEKPTYPAFGAELEQHIATKHPAQQPVTPCSELLEHLAKVKSALIRDHQSASTTAVPQKPRQMARKSVPRGGKRPRSTAGPAAAKAAAKSGAAKATPANCKLAKRARMAVQTDDAPIVGSSCLMAPGYRPLLFTAAGAGAGAVARDAAIACAQLDASGRLALVGPAGNGHSGLACLACGKVCPDPAQFWAHASDCQKKLLSGAVASAGAAKQSGVCPLCSLEVADLNAHTVRHRRRMLPASWHPGPEPQPVADRQVPPASPATDLVV